MKEIGARLTLLQASSSYIEKPFGKKGVHIVAKAYTPRESVVYLGSNFHRKGYQTIQLTVSNYSDRSYLLSQEGIDLPNVEGKKMALQIYRQSIPRAIAFKVASFFFWPFVIPSMIDSIATYRSYLHIKRDLHIKTIKQEGELLHPYSTIHRVLIVSHQHIEDSFEVFLQETHRGFWISHSVQVQFS